MIPSFELENPFLLARALAPLCQQYLMKAQAVPGRNRGFRFRGAQREIELCGKARYDAVKELDESDPLRVALLRWVHRLTEMRVNQMWLDEDERLDRQAPHVVREPVESKMTVADLKKQAISTQGEESRLWWRNVETQGASLSAHRSGYFARCAEFHARLGEQDVRAYFSASYSKTSAQLILAPALGTTRDLLSESEVEDFPGLIRLGLGEILGEGWPARLSPDTMIRLFSAPELFRGVDLQPGALPERLVPASFLRAGYQVGRALGLAWAPADRPFVLVRDPDDFFGHRLGFLFVLWMLSPRFDEKTLGLGRSLEKERRRGRGQVLLALSALSACRAQLFELCINHHAAPHELEETVLEQLRLTEHRPQRSVLSWLSVRRDEPTRLFALLDAVLTYEELVHDFDLDWWRNPKALEKLRADHSIHACIAVSDERLRAGLDLLQAQLREALS